MTGSREAMELVCTFRNCGVCLLGTIMHTMHNMHFRVIHERVCAQWFVQSVPIVSLLCSHEPLGSRCGLFSVTHGVFGYLGCKWQVCACVHKL